MTTNVGKLITALAHHTDLSSSPEVLHEIMVAMAKELDATGFGIEAAKIRRAARTMVPMFAWHGAEDAWVFHRKTFSWWRRLWMPWSATREFKAEWSKGQIDIGQSIVREALRVSTHG